MSQNGILRKGFNDDYHKPGDYLLHPKACSTATQSYLFVSMVLDI